MPEFQVEAPYEPKGDQPSAIEDLVQGLKQGMDRQTLLGVTGSGKTFTLSSTSPEVGETTESLQASVSGEDLLIHFNHRYVTDCLQSISAESITLAFSGPGKPLVVRGSADEGFLYLVMPMNKEPCAPSLRT
jgi:DNA polymerase III sliding clamp (beta) subunit (PCNA family)